MVGLSIVDNGVKPGGDSRGGIYGQVNTGNQKWFVPDAELADSGVLMAKVAEYSKWERGRKKDGRPGAKGHGVFRNTTVAWDLMDKTTLVGAWFL